MLEGATNDREEHHKLVTVLVVLELVPEECVRAMEPLVPTSWPVLEEVCELQLWDALGDPAQM